MIDRGTWLVLFLIVLLQEGCSTCYNQLVDRRESAQGTLATLLTCECGSTEGWAVNIKLQTGEEQQVALVVMPHPTSVTDVPHHVSIEWQGERTLEVSVPHWAGFLDRKESFGAISVVYVRNNNEYPGTIEKYP